MENLLKFNFCMKKSVILISFLFFSCSKDYLFNKNQLLISDEIKNIISIDQGVRNYNELINIKYKIRDFDYICDSMYKAGLRGNLNNYFDFSTIETKEIQISRFDSKTRDNYYSDLEFGQKFVEVIDDINRKELYKLIKKNGYPSFYNREWIDTTNVRVGVVFVLTHTDFNSDFGKRILKLMIKEYFKGRVDVGEMKHLMWHVDGRNSSLSNYKIDEIELKKRYKEL